MANWIAGAVSKNPGALTRKAKAAGQVTAKGTIKKSFLKKKTKNPTLNKQKNLAIILEAMHGGKK
jgi:hypothetical protein